MQRLEEEEDDITEEEHVKHVLNSYAAEAHDGADGGVFVDGGEDLDQLGPEGLVHGVELGRAAHGDMGNGAIDTIFERGEFHNFGPSAKGGA